MPAELPPPPRFANVVDYVFERAHDSAIARKPALILEDGACSYADIFARLCRAGNVLKALGLKPGQRMVMSVVDGADFPALFFGAIKASIVAIPINTYLKPADYLYYINDSEARLVVVDHSLVPAIEQIKGEFASVAHVVVAGERVDGYAFLDDLLAEASPELDSVPHDPEDVAFWLYSSGSTGNPKGVIHRHESIYWATELFGLPKLRLVNDDVVLVPPKMFFAYGLGAQLYFPFRAGAATVINDQMITPQRIWDLWLKHEPTLVLSVPTLYAGQLKIAKEDLGRERTRQACQRLRFCVSAGEILPTALYEDWKAFTGTEILDAVGTTEMLHTFTINEPGKMVPGSCGRLAEGYRAEIVDDDDAPVADGEIGNFHVIGPSASREYWNKPELTRKVMGRGGVMTGDKVYRDADGNYFIVGRSDDMLRVGGIWVSPAEVEGAIAQHESVLECAVVGHPDQHQMIKPKAFVVLKQAVEDEAAHAETLKAFVKTRLTHIKCPRWIAFVDELPRTTTGKIQRFHLRARADEQTERRSRT